MARIKRTLEDGSVIYLDPTTREVLPDPAAFDPSGSVRGMPGGERPPGPPKPPMADIKPFANGTEQADYESSRRARNFKNATTEEKWQMLKDRPLEGNYWKVAGGIGQLLQPGTGNQKAQAASDVINGGLGAAAPFVLPEAALAKPVTTAAQLAAGLLGQHMTGKFLGNAGVQKDIQNLGVDPKYLGSGYRNLASDAVGGGLAYGLGKVSPSLLAELKSGGLWGLVKGMVLGQGGSKAPGSATATETPLAGYRVPAPPAPRPAASTPVPEPQPLNPLRVAAPPSPVKATAAANPLEQLLNPAKVPVPPMPKPPAAPLVEDLMGKPLNAAKAPPLPKPTPAPAVVAEKPKIVPAPKVDLKNVPDPDILAEKVIDNKVKQSNAERLKKNLAKKKPEDLFDNQD